MLDLNPTVSSVFRDKGRIMPIAVLLCAVQLSHFVLTNSDDSNSNEMRRALKDGA